MTFNSILSPVTYLKDILVIRIHIYSFFPSNVLHITDKISFRQFIRVVVTQTLIMLAWLNLHDHEETLLHHWKSIRAENVPTSEIV